MPFKSKKQQRYMHYLASKGKLPKSIDLNEWDESTNFKNLPDEAIYTGGEVNDPYKEDPSLELMDYHEGFDDESARYGQDILDMDHDDEEEYWMGGKIKGPKIRAPKMYNGGFVKAIKRRRE